jgi:hypothetical protein
VFKNEQAHPFYRPLWRRYLIVAITIVWALMEWFYANDPFWGMLATALAGYAGWVLIYTFPEETKQQTEASTRDERE